MSARKKRWFALAVHLDYPEAEVRREIGRAAKIQGVERLVGRVLLIRHKEHKTLVNGSEVVHRVKSYPGYLIASLAYCDAVADFLLGVPGVQGLLPLPLHKGEKPNPTALDSIEAAEQLLKVEAAKKAKPNPYAEARRGYGAGPVAAGPVEKTARLGLGKDSPVKLTGGPFSGYEGKVSKVLNRSTVAVEVLFMGKATTKVMDESQLEPTERLEQ